MFVAPPSRGTTARQQVTFVRLGLTGAAKCTLRTRALNLSRNSAFLKLDVLRTPTLHVKMPLELSNVISNAVPPTTAMSVQLSVPVASCC